MRTPIRAPVAILIGAFAMVGVCTAGPGTAEPLTPALVDHTEWADRDGLPGLRVYLTPAGRASAGRFGSDAQADDAWREVLASAPGADAPGMRAQFLCHWRYAELARPGKSSWNLEPWRPVVDEVTMLESGCNPGGAEEMF